MLIPTLIGSGLFLLLCAIVFPILWMTIETRRNSSTSQKYGSIVINLSMLVTTILGLLGILLAVIGVGHSTLPNKGWGFIGLGLFFLICAFVVPVFWGRLTHKLAGPSAELEGIVGIAYTIIIAIAFGLLSIIFLITGTLLEILY